MKKYFSLLVFIFITNVIQAQFGTKYEEAQITLKEGTVIKGYARINLNDLDFKDENKKNKKNILFSEITNVKFSVLVDKKKNIKKELFLESIKAEKNAKNTKGYALAELILDREKIKIYGVYALDGGGGFSMGAGLGGQVSVTNMSIKPSGNVTNTNNYTDYYCWIKNENYARCVYLYTSLKTFRIMASQCFKDCMTLSDKINNKEFKEKDIIEIGNFYNDQCN